MQSNWTPTREVLWQETVQELYANIDNQIVDALLYDWTTIKKVGVLNKSELQRKTGLHANYINEQLTKLKALLRQAYQQ